MENEKLMSMLSRLFFVGALAALGFAIVEKGLNMIGQNFPGIDVDPAQVLSWTSPLLLFVIAIVLRQMREEMRRS